MQKALELNIKL